MIQKLTLDDVLTVLKTTPEQCVFDWKQDLNLDGEEKKSELLKDVIAVANATNRSPGFVFFGVDPRRPDMVIGLSKSYDDAAFQQLFAGKVEPGVDFLYYELTLGARKVGVIHVPPSTTRPHIVARDFGKLRQGQILIRQGSTTRGISRDELFSMFYSSSSPYLRQVLQHYGQQAAITAAQAAKMRELRETRNSLTRSLEASMGLPRGMLG